MPGKEVELRLNFTAPANPGKYDIVFTLESDLDQSYYHQLRSVFEVKNGGVGGAQY
jgi:hypothetical protein